MILVTGATGFLGSELVRQLASHNKPIRAIKRSTSVVPEIIKQQKNIDWIDADVLDYFSLQEAFDHVSQVYHCAAVVSFSPSDKKRMLQTNVQGTANVVNLCLDKNVQKLVHVSSIAALGDGKLNQPITENDHWEFTSKQSSYAISKYESEMEVFRAVAEGLNAIVVNPSIILGENASKSGSGILFEAVKNGLSYYPGGTCGLVAVEDVVESMIALMNGDFSAERYIISAETWLYRDLFTEIAFQLRVNPPNKELKPWMLQATLLANFITNLITKNSNGLTKDMARILVKKRDYVNSKIKKTIGIEFKSVKQVIAEVCD